MAVEANGVFLAGGAKACTWVDDACMWSNMAAASANRFFCIMMDDYMVQFCLSGCENLSPRLRNMDP